MRKMFVSLLLGVIALGTLAVAIPTPVAVSCLYCVPIYDCPPCYELGGGSCFKCPTCVRIHGCKT